jgi:hypothetical protein
MTAIDMRYLRLSILLSALLFPNLTLPLNVLKQI